MNSLHVTPELPQGSPTLDWESTRTEKSAIQLQERYIDIFGIRKPERAALATVQVASVFT
ncbi:hypothetical protein KSX_30100 [Ktedonospora formicarum]|uniref:Uncharacterized protein n=1 Tax=Ktedonospora formicarum TaxID=2778364 RepID=A0A8J3MQF3_9CHLR|nr:hypothetical protein KSX_30100 [Ktedonospora formicarum]